MFDISRIASRSFKTPNEVFKGAGGVTFRVDDRFKDVKRQCYGFLDLLGDIGGVKEAFLIIIGVFISPISEHMYTLKAISQLFLARSTDKNLFLRS